MFDLQGHSIEFTGAPILGLHPENDTGLGALIEYVPFIGDADDLESVTMVCWGEDMAKVPLLVWTDEVKPAWVDDTLTEDHVEKLASAGHLVRTVLDEENARAEVMS